MRRLTNIERDAVRIKFGGHCAYCGERLGKRWHADHLEPVVRSDWLRSGAAPESPHNHRPDNMMPACARCNISKSSMSLEVWRSWLAGHVGSLNRNQPTYRIAKAFGLIEETGASVVFHFEKGAGDA